MNTIHKIEDWGNSHRPGWLDMGRIILGLFITFKGFQFMFHIDSLETTTQDINLGFSGVILAHYVIFAHALGGPLIAFGLFTRFICILQLPILIGAVIFVNYSRGFLSTELYISVTALIGLIVFIVFGAGKFSLDERRRKDLKAIH